MPSYGRRNCVWNLQQRTRRNDGGLIAGGLNTISCFERLWMIMGVYGSLEAENGGVWLEQVWFGNSSTLQHRNISQQCALQKKKFWKCIIWPWFQKVPKTSQNTLLTINSIAKIGKMRRNCGPLAARDLLFEPHSNRTGQKRILASLEHWNHGAVECGQPGGFFAWH